jgi:hypothetical protein
VKIKLGVKCMNCGNWNRIEVEKIFVNAGISESKLQIFLPAYLPLRTEKCSKCDQVIVKENRLIRQKKS